MDDSKLRRIVGLKRQIAALQANERRLAFVSTSPKQTADYRRQAQRDLVQVRRRLAKVNQELNGTEREQ